jgi:hypothetical protein
MDAPKKKDVDGKVFAVDVVDACRCGANPICA